MSGLIESSVVPLDFCALEQQFGLLDLLDFLFFLVNLGDLPFSRCTCTIPGIYGTNVPGNTRISPNAHYFFAPATKINASFIMPSKMPSCQVQCRV